VSTRPVASDKDADKASRVVLVVEDERSIASFVAEAVGDAGHRAVLMRNGREALEWAREHWPDLVVTDLMMPHIDGASLVLALKVEAVSHSRAMPPVILMTTASPSYARAVGADALLRKPFDLAEFDALLRRFLG
jgi:DNA-binding response OmpR family regulator